jgi:amino acid adenylation domain-containing protein
MEEKPELTGRDRTEAQMRQETLDFWRKELDGAIPWLSLPKDRKVIEGIQPVMEWWDTQFNADLVHGLERLAGEHGVRLSTVLLAGFEVLLFRYTGWRDLIVACPDKDCFGRALPVRIVVDETGSFLDLLNQVEAALHDLNQHRDFTASLWLELLPSKRSEQHLLPSPVRFAGAEAVTDMADATGAEAGTKDGDSRGELTLMISGGETGLRARFLYNAQLFQSVTVQWMACHYHELLRQAVREPEKRLEDLKLATLEELTTVRQWGYGEPGPLQNQLYHERFQSQAAQRPEATAVVFEGGRLTYRELDHRANQLARHLQDLGVGPDVVVGLLMECSPELVIANLAVFKAGGGVFFLPPAFPPARLSALLKLSAPAVVVTKKRFIELLRDLSLHVICLDDPDPCLAIHPGTAPPNRATAQNLAYFFLTSGSTGQPKIVMEPFGRLRSQQVDATTERYILKSNTGTTFTAAEVMSVTRGGTLFIAPEGIEKDVRNLAVFIGDHQITYLILVPSALGALLSLDDLTSCNSLRTVHCIGEMVTPGLKRRFFERLHARLLIGYGCTEARGATSRWCTPDDDPALADAGRPSPTMEVFVLDARLQPMPIGVPGEVYLGGQIAAGYVKNPVATAERFIPHPFSDRSGAHLFRTGDLARWLPDGNLEILGRTDSQVKIRGFRIELGEIEAVLAQYPGLSQNLVVARERAPGEKQLVAYLVPRDKLTLSLGELRRYLREKLPDYMLPSAFVILEKLPLLPNGKVDRQALPLPGVERPQMEHDYVEPRDAVEEQLAKFWAEVLRLERVGIHDSFFDLGGHSLSAVRLIGHIERKFGIRMPVATLFRYSTIAELAMLLEAGTLPQSWSSLMLIQPEGSRLPFFWVHGDASTVLLPEYLGPDQPLYALEHQAHDGRPARYTQTETIAKHYLDEVRKVRPHGPYLLGGFSFGAVTAFEMAQQLRQEGEPVSLLFMLDPPPSIKREEEAPVRPSLKEEFKRHWTELSHAGFREKLDYLAPRVKGQVLGRTVRIRKHLKKLRCRCYLTTGRLLPVSLRSGYILNIYGKALQSYVPQSYPGRVMLCKSEKVLYRPSMDWRKLCRGELKVYELDGKYTHVELTKEPCVAQWAQRLKAALDGLHFLDDDG